MTDDNIEALRAAWKRASSEFERADAAERDARNALARALCPYRVGDVVDVEGFHEGRWKVLYVVGSSYIDEDWCLHVVNVKKDGTEGKRRCQLEPDSWTRFTKVVRED